MEQILSSPKQEWSSILRRSGISSNRVVFNLLSDVLRLGHPTLFRFLLFHSDISGLDLLTPDDWSVILNLSIQGGTSDITNYLKQYLLK